MLNQKNSMKLIGWIISFEIVGFLLGLVTQANIYSWYEGLDKSILTPPGWVFSVVWSILYACLAIVGFILWQKRDSRPHKTIFHLYLVQMLMNWIWTPLFFQWHWLALSFLWIVVMVGLNAAIIILAIKNKEKVITFLMLPYLLWLMFAGYLNGVIWILNR